MKAVFQTIALLFMHIQSLFAQSYFSTVYGKPYPFVSGIYSVLQLADSSYLTTLNTHDFFSSESDLNILSVDKHGKVTNQLNYGVNKDSTGYETDWFFRINDSTIMTIGLEHDSTFFWHSFLLFLNNNGDSINSLSYSFPGAIETYLGAYCKSNDGGHFLLGAADYADSVFNQPPFPNYLEFTDRQMLIVKMDSAFNPIWAKEYGFPDVSESANDVTASQDGGMIVAGKNYDYINFEAVISKYNDQGNFVWQKTWFTPGRFRAFTKVLPTPDRNYIACGPWLNDPFENPDDPKGEGGILMKVTPDGQLIWQKEYRSETDENNFYDMVQLDDGSLVLVGYEDYDNTTGQSDQTAKLTKLDADGNVIWNRTYDYYEKTRTTAIEKTFDGGFVLSGWAVLEGPTPKSSIGWILKVDSMGCESSMCLVDATEPTPPRPTEIQLFPNPTSDFLNLEMPKNGHFDVKIIDFLGKTLLTDSFFGDRFSMDVSRLPTGLVVVQIFEKGVLVAVEKVVLVR